MIVVTTTFAFKYAFSNAGIAAYSMPARMPASTDSGIWSPTGMQSSPK